VPVRVLIVDDHTLVRAGLARLLQGFADVQLVAEASNAEQALQLSLQHAPDVVLMDLSLPGRTGLEVTTLGYGAMELRGAPRGRAAGPGLRSHPAHPGEGHPGR